MPTIVLPKPIKRIFIDLDDTMVDFMGSVYNLLRLHNHISMDNDLKKLWNFVDVGGGRGTMWEEIIKAGPNWWANLKKLPWADELWEVCNRVCGDVVILTSPSDLPDAAAGKMMWALDNFGVDKLIIAKKKHLCSNPGSILIDDWDKFSVPWEKQGGKAILLRREWSNVGFLPDEIISCLNNYI